jgi:hypothetical protein
MQQTRRNYSENYNLTLFLIISIGMLVTGTVSITFGKIHLFSPQWIYLNIEWWIYKYLFEANTWAINSVCMEKIALKLSGIQKLVQNLPPVTYAWENNAVFCADSCQKRRSFVFAIITDFSKLTQPTVQQEDRKFLFVEKVTRRLRYNMTQSTINMEVQ